jgi:uncharacterized membrane protein
VDARTLHAILPVAIVIGLALSAFAAYETAFPAAEKACTVNGFISCSKVDQSAYSSTFGIPDYWAGIAGFALMLAIDIPLLRTWKASWLTALLVVSGLGLVAAVYLAYVELVIVGALCLICTGAYLANVAVFGVTAALYRQHRAEARGPAAAPPSA